MEIETKIEDSSARNTSCGLRNSSGNRTMGGKELPLRKKIIRDFIIIPAYAVSGMFRWLGFVNIANNDAIETVPEILRQEDLAQLSERVVREGLI